MTVTPKIIELGGEPSQQEFVTERKVFQNQVADDLERLGLSDRPPRPLVEGISAITTWICTTKSWR